MKYMRVTCVECGKEAEEMRQLEDEIYICEWCHIKVTNDIIKILNEEQEKFK